MAAGVDNSNFGKWLKGGPTLSSANVEAVLNELGLPNLKADVSRVHIWHINSPPKGNISKLDLISALGLYFPNKGEIAKAPWALGGLKNLKRLVVHPWKQPKAIYAITDGQVRAVLRLTVPMLLQKENIKSYLKWRDGAEATSIMNIADTEEQWTEGVPSVSEFDAVWDDKDSSVNAVDLIAAVREKGITFQEAIKRIQKNNS